MKHTGKILTLWACLCLSAAGLSGDVVAQSALNDQQRDEVKSIIKDYLLNNPDVLREALQVLESYQKEQETARISQSIRDNAKLIFRSKRAHVAGNPNGNVTMVEFFDYNCGYCKRAMGDVLALLEADKELRLVVKEFPILGPGSLFASRAAIASRKQGKYWEFHLALMGARGSLDEDLVMRTARDVGLDTDQLAKDMEAEDVAATLEESFALADALGIRGTPAFIIDDKLIPGALGREALGQEIASVRDNGGCMVC